MEEGLICVHLRLEMVCRILLRLGIARGGPDSVRGVLFEV